MGCSTVSLGVVVVFCILYQFSLPVDGNWKLIRDVCNKTTEPHHCMDCARSNPVIAKKDVIGLAGNALNCVYFNTLAVRKTLVSYAANKSSDSRFKQAATSCLSLISLTRDHLRAALLDWILANYTGSLTEVLAAKVEFQNCAMQLRRRYPNYEPGFITVLNKFRSYCEVAEGVLGQIEGAFII